MDSMGLCFGIRYGMEDLNELKTALKNKFLVWVDSSRLLHIRPITEQNKKIMENDLKRCQDE